MSSTEVFRRNLTTEEVDFANNAGYTGVKEDLYTMDNPEIIEWTKFFHQRSDIDNIFGKFARTTKDIKIDKAIAVASQWYRFSSFMPWFLSRAASMVSDNEKRHYVIQTAYEELGMRDVEEIHPEMFREAAVEAGVKDECFKQLTNYEPVTKQLGWLANQLIQCDSDSEVMGMLLGLECPADENIDTIFNALAHNEIAKHQASESKFFKLHRAIETEHVRLTVSNYIRFCPDQTKKEQFIRGFDSGINFWRGFWGEISILISSLVSGAKQIH